MGLLEQIKKPNAKAFTHSGKFHADDVFSSALLLYLNPQITITRGNRVPEDYDGIVFDIGRGLMKNLCSRWITMIIPEKRMNLRH